MTRDEMLLKMPKGLVCAEVGVLNGDFSRKILDITKPEWLFLIDPWGEQAVEIYQDAANVDQVRQDARYNRVIGRFYEDKNVSIMRGYSYDELKNQCDLDWVYIDGNHSYDAVTEDLEIAKESIKQTGFIAGHDYAESARDGTKFGVIEAVTEFMRRNPDFKLRFLSDERWATYILSRHELPWLWCDK